MHNKFGEPAETSIETRNKRTGRATTGTANSRRNQFEKGTDFDYDFGEYNGYKSVGCIKFPNTRFEVLTA